MAAARDDGAAGRTARHSGARLSDGPLLRRSRSDDAVSGEHREDAHVPRAREAASLAAAARGRNTRAGPRQLKPDSRLSALRPPSFLTGTRDIMIRRKHLYSILNPTVLAVFACVGLSACNDDDNNMQQPAPAQPDPHAVYPTVHIQNAAPSGADYIQDTELGTLLTASVNGQQLTLYTFGNDTAGTSNCTINADSTGCAK